MYDIGALGKFNGGIVHLYNDRVETDIE